MAKFFRNHRKIIYIIIFAILIVAILFYIFYPQSKQLGTAFIAQNKAHLTINTSKSIYSLNEQVYLQIAVLGDRGITVCNANLELRIKNKQINREIILLTENGTIERSTECGPDSKIVNVPDYLAYYQASEVGVHQMTLTNLDTGFEVIDSFEVKSAVVFDVERKGPTRIYPLADYEMIIKIKANQDFNGDIIETIPSVFKVPISNVEYRIKNIGNNKNILIWQNITLNKNEELELKYQFDAPDVSPYLYLLGPLRLEESSSAVIFKEFRQWQIASDDNTEAKTAGTASAGAWDSFTTANLSGSDGNDATNNDVEDAVGTLSNFSFGIPADAASIDGIVVTIEARENNVKCNAYILSSLSWNDGANYTSTYRSPDSGELTTGDVVHTEGGTTDDWGHTWSVNEINNNFMLKILGHNEKSGKAVEIDHITVTVYYTPNAPIVSVYIKDGIIAYGNVVDGASSTTTSDTQYVINNGNVTENFNIIGDDTTSWDLTTSSVGSELYMHLFTTTSGAYWPKIDRSYITLETGITVDSTSTVDFYIKLPSVTTDYTEQSTTITIQAVAQ